MTESPQDLERRQRIYKVLDDLKAKGERINADKVARLAQMGKQTVLPCYRDWRNEGELDREMQDELPDELVLTLKRGIVRWKQTLKQEWDEFQDEANNEIDDLKQTIKTILEKQSLKESEIQKLNSTLEQTEQTLTEQQQLNHDKDQQLASLHTRLEVQESHNETLTAQLQQEKEDHSGNIQQLEARLDQRHQEQLNHWIKIVDDERRQKQSLEKNVAQQQEQQLIIEKEKNEFSYRLDAKNKAYIYACEERNELKTQYQSMKPLGKIVEQNTLLLNCAPEEITDRLRQMQATEHRCHLSEEQLNQSQDKIKNLQQALTSADHRVKQVNSLEIQLEKAKSYAEALERSLPADNGAAKGK